MIMTTLLFPWLLTKNPYRDKNCDRFFEHMCEVYKKYAIFELKFWGFIIFFPFILIYGIVKLFMNCCKQKEK